jgi:hypothetical protein
MFRERPAALGVFALLMAFMVGAVAPAGAATGPNLNYSNEDTPNPYVHESTLTVAEHDMAAMDGLKDYYDDSGELAEIDATVNSSQDERLGFRADKVVIPSLQEYPRVDGEDGSNPNTWLNASNWTTSTTDSTNVSPSLPDADGTTATGVDAVQFSTTGMGAGDDATATFGESTNITNDVTKRTLQFTGQINDLSGDIQIRLVDSDGGYYYANATTGDNSSEDWAIANATGDGYVYQEKVSNLNKSGSPDSIDKIEVKAHDDNVNIVITGLDVETKGTFNLGEVSHDFDGDGDETRRVISEINNDPNEPGPGVVKYTERSALGDELASAVIHDLEVYNVRYQASDLSSSDDYEVEFSDAEDYGGYDKQLEHHARLHVISAIDLTHGNLEVRDDQGLVSERFKTAEIATATGSTNLTNVSDSSYSDVSSNYGTAGQTRTLKSSGINAGENIIVHMVVVLSDDEANAMMGSAVSGGPSGSSGGFLSGFWSFFTSVPGMALTALTGAGIAARRAFGGS